MSFDHVAKLISDITHKPIDLIREESRFSDDLGIDSLNLVNLFIQLSERTNTGFNQFIQAEDMKTVGGIYQAITKGENHDNN